MEVYFPQLEELADRDAEIRDFIKQIADRMNTLESLVTALQPQRTKPQPIETQPETVKPAKPVEAQKAKRKAKANTKVESEDSEADTDADTEDTEANDNNLYARAAFEAKRTNRVLGIGATRTAIKKFGGQNAISVDDVPASKLPALIKALEAM
jgi:hypothetical protein